MELDEMKSAWLALDRRMQRQEILNVHFFQEGRLDKLRASLRPLVASRIVQIIVGGLLAILFAPFWIEHLDTPHLVVIGLLLHGYALTFIVFAARDLYMIRRVDYSAPVVEIQRRLAELRAWRIRVAVVFGAIGCFNWIPLVLWLFVVVFGVDVYALNPEVVYVFIASGFACLGFMLLLIRWAWNPRRARFAESLEDSVVGRSIGKAEKLLDEIAAFAREA